MQDYLIVSTLLLLSLGCHGPAATTMRREPGDGLGGVLHTLIVDSLIGGGRRSGQVYVAADTASDALLRAAGIAVVPRANASPLPCPGSTDATGAPEPGTVGYVLRVRRTQQASGALHLDVDVSCSFVFRGGARNFGQGGTWELRRIGDRWHLVGTLEDWIT